MGSLASPVYGRSDMVHGMVDSNGTSREPLKMPHIDSFLDGYVAGLVILRTVDVTVIV